MALSAHRKKEILKLNHLNIYIKKLEEDNKLKPRKVRIK